jgi:TatD DNase family protein
VTVNLVDTHCHLDFTAFDEDREAVVERARQAGVQRILNPGIDLATSRRAIDLASDARFPEVYAAVGVHPNDANSWTADTLDELYRLAQHPKVVAMGEIGLDYYRERAPHALQQTILEQQLALAFRCQKPVIIHLRNSDSQDRTATLDLLAILRKWWYMLRAENSTLSQAVGVLHSFSETEAIALQALEMNFWIGVTGPVTFRNAVDTQTLVSRLPLDRLLIETDAPFLTPQPKRGQRNEPGYVHWVAEKIACLKDLTLAEVARITTENATRLFNW